jgi:hypothetical protein
MGSLFTFPVTRSYWPRLGSSSCPPLADLNDHLPCSLTTQRNQMRILLNSTFRWVRCVPRQSFEYLKCGLVYNTYSADEATSYPVWASVTEEESCVYLYEFPSGLWTPEVEMQQNISVHYWTLQTQTWFCQPKYGMEGGECHAMGLAYRERTNFFTVLYCTLLYFA